MAHRFRTNTYRTTDWAGYFFRFVTREWVTGTQTEDSRSRKIIGWQLSDTIATTNVTMALKMAMRQHSIGRLTPTQAHQMTGELKRLWKSRRKMGLEKIAQQP